MTILVSNWMNQGGFCIKDTHERSFYVIEDSIGSIGINNQKLSSADIVN